MTEPHEDHGSPVRRDVRVPAAWRAHTVGLRKALRIVVPIVLIAALLYGADWSRAADEIAQIPMWPLVMLFMVMVVELIVSTVKWSCALRMHNLSFPFKYLLRALCSGFFLNSFLPTAIGGDVYRVYRTLPKDHFRSRALSAVLIERAVGLLALLALGGVAAFLIAHEYQVARVYSLVLLAITVVGAIGILALERGWLHGAMKRFDRIAAVAAVHHSIGLLGNRGRDWLSLVAMSAVYQAISIGVVFCLFALLSADVTLAEAALITALVGVAALLPITINGLGVMEGALVGGAVMLGIDFNQAVVVAFLRRMLNLSLAASCGVLHLTTFGQGDQDSGEKSFSSSLVSLRRRLFGSRNEASGASRPSPAETSSAPTAKAAYEDLLDSTQDAIIIWEMGGGGIQYLNRAAEQLYGYSRDEVYGRTTHELLKTHIAGGVDLLERTVARFGVWLGELRHTTRDGREIEVEGRLALMAQRDGRWLVLEVNRDISDDTAAEAAREQMACQLSELQTSRMRV